MTVYGGCNKQNSVHVYVSIPYVIFTKNNYTKTNVKWKIRNTNYDYNEHKPEVYKWINEINEWTDKYDHVCTAYDSFVTYHKITPTIIACGNGNKPTYQNSDSLTMSTSGLVSSTHNRIPGKSSGWSAK